MKNLFTKRLHKNGKHHKTTLVCRPVARQLKERIAILGLIGGF
jgi:hypothetical protein